MLKKNTQKPEGSALRVWWQPMVTWRRPFVAEEINAGNGFPSLGKCR